ncbi:MAG: HAD-IIIA family hydrolase [Gemmatimonadetes bacterium]|nr:HAD-IIIA family hydrolase [Gemmatimonadota bacterium]
MKRSVSRIVRAEAEAEAPDREISRGIAKGIRLVVLDVDGVLTDGGVYVGLSAGGEEVELKRFDIQDGLALKLLRASGVEVALVSGRVSAATALRAEELGIRECYQDAGARKLPVVREIMERLGLDWSEVAMVGDDLPDLPVLTRVGFPVAVANAVPEVRRVALWSTRREGGRGAVREFVRALLLARGDWDRAVSDYCAARTDD